MLSGTFLTSLPIIFPSLTCLQAFWSFPCFLNILAHFYLRVFALAAPSAWNTLPQIHIWFLCSLLHATEQRYFSMRVSMTILLIIAHTSTLGTTYSPSSFIFLQSIYHLTHTIIIYLWFFFKTLPFSLHLNASS